MSSQFWIQVGSPRWHGQVESDATSLDEAVDSVFLRDTEDALIVWNHVYIPLSYKYDVAIILLDVIAMIETLLDNEAGEWQIDWPSNTFLARWNFKWKREDLVVTALQWLSVVGDTEEILRGRPALSIGKMEFVCEWKALLERVHVALLGAGFSACSFSEIERLGSTISRIPSYGILYR